MITSKGDSNNLRALAYNAGDILMLAACLVYSVYTILLRERPAVSGLAMFAVMATAATLAAIPFVVWEVVQDSLVWPTLAGWATLAFVVLFPSFASQLFFMRGVQLVGPARAGIFVNLVPIFASFLSVLILGETFAVFHAVGLVLVLGGIWVAERSSSEG